MNYANGLVTACDLEAVLPGGLLMLSAVPGHGRFDGGAQRAEAGVALRGVVAGK
ncbi:hypothetical protein [Trebonia kvetii]|uniref:hypothetical protein n=1 Tax=Trebonia kvetii TaxID=2480626 RepID=UPI0016525445|nr:hypothetical protein [Trebonia kvetii]